MDDWDARDEYGFKVTPEQFKKTLETKFGEMKSPKQKDLIEKQKLEVGYLDLEKLYKIWAIKKLINTIYIKEKYGI